MKAKLYLSWVALALGVVFGWSSIGDTWWVQLTAALCCGYVLWALYWGIPVVWRWWCSYSATRGSRDATLQGLVLWFLRGLLVALIGGLFYGIFGGAFQTWRKTRAPRRQE